MKKLHGHPRFYELIEEIRDLHSRKSYNYAFNNDPLSNLRASEKIGIESWKGVFVRITDKYDRLTQLALGKEDRVGEDIKETFKDIAVYALLAIILYEDKHGRA